MQVAEKKKRGRPRTRPVKYTEDERRLLAYPPTENTWMCQNRYGENDSLCDVPNAGYSDVCWVCGTARPEIPVLAWEKYSLVCAKVGIDPYLRKSVDIDNYNIVKEGGEEVFPLWKRRKKQTAVDFAESVKPAEAVDPVVEAAKDLVIASLDGVEAKPVAVKKAAKKPAAPKTVVTTTKPPVKKTVKRKA